MGRVGRGNRGIHLTENVQLETLTNISVHPLAGIYETGKIAFHDAGHDHTGGDSGSVIEFTANLISNSNFDRAISPLGYPDHWFPSGYPLADIEAYQQKDGAYFGDYCVYMSGIPYNPNDIFEPRQIPHLYQSVPAPSGILWALPPSGSDFAGRELTVGIYAKGLEVDDIKHPYGGMLVGVYSDGFGYMWQHYNLTKKYDLYKHTFPLTDPSGSLSVCIAPSGRMLIDNVQASLGKRLPATIPRYNEKDLDAWNRLIEAFVNTSEWDVSVGDVMVYDNLSQQSVTHPTVHGQGGIAGVSIANSTPISGTIVSLCTLGKTEVNVFGEVNIGDMLFAGVINGFEGYAISSTYISKNNVSLENPFSFARALESTPGPSGSMIVADIYSQGNYFGTITGGAVYDVMWEPIIDIEAGGNDTYLLTVEGDTTINMIGGMESTSDTFIFTNDGIDDWKVMMGDGTIVNGIILVPTNESVTLSLQYDKVYWWECGRQYGLIPLI